jgi:hypothetical protein
LSQNANRDDNGDAVADTAFGNLIADPHQEQSSRSHDQHGQKSEGDAGIGDERDPKAGNRIRDSGKKRIGLRALEGKGEEPSLKNTKGNRRIAGVLGDLLATSVLAS